MVGNLFCINFLDDFEMILHTRDYNQIAKVSKIIKDNCSLFDLILFNEVNQVPVVACIYIYEWVEGEC